MSAASSTSIDVAVAAETPVVLSTEVYADLIGAYPTWDALSTFLGSEAGGSLRIDDVSTADSPFAIIRYAKGKSDLTKPHVRAFRSVVWDTLEHRPASVTAWKSTDGEGVPEALKPSECTIESFVDGVMIGMFWDKYSNRWRIHTRSTLDAACRYYSQTTTFATLFWSTLSAAGVRPDVLDKTLTYTWILQHPENRVVCEVRSPRVTAVETIRVGVDAKVEFVPVPRETVPGTVRTTLPGGGGAVQSWDSLRALLADWNRRFKHNIQGLVIKDGHGRRWKVRTAEYNRVRVLRGNTPRRDWIWLNTWKGGPAAMHAYFLVYPEENAAANALIERWKSVTNDVYRIYVDAFKARTLDRKSIPAKYRPLVYGLHNKYMTELKPAGQTLTWKATVEWMNGRDLPQMLFVLNWELRQAAQQLGVAAIPIEPPAVAVAAAAEEPAEAAVAAEGGAAAEGAAAVTE
jgi:hypothetical protein